MITNFQVRFLSPLDTRKYTTPGEFVLLSDYAIEIFYKGVWYIETIPRGFITDFASVPALVQSIPGFGVNDDSAYSAVGHDYHYCRQGFLEWRRSGVPAIKAVSLTREECDQLLYAGLIAKGYSGAEALAFYEGVRLGGASHWATKDGGLDTEVDFVPDSYWGAITA